jgi:hypothetical protein
MVTTIRAALSVAMLLGFYLYALVAVVLLGALSLLAIEYAPGVICRQGGLGHPGGAVRDSRGDLEGAASRAEVVPGFVELEVAVPAR